MARKNERGNTDELHVCVSPALERDLEELAAELDITLSKLVRCVLKQFIAWQKESKRPAE